MIENLQIESGTIITAEDDYDLLSLSVKLPFEAPLRGDKCSLLIEVDKGKALGYCKKEMPSVPITMIP